MRAARFKVKLSLAMERMGVKGFFLLAAVLPVLLAACSATPEPGTPVPAVATSTATVPSPAPTETNAPTLTATPVLLRGTLKTQVNVRSGPGSSYDAIALLEAGASVDILAQDAPGAWLQIVHPAGAGGIGWVSAQFVDAGGQVIPSITPVITPTAAGPTARVTQRLNVRAGPATTFDPLGTLEAEAVVTLTGKNRSGSWLQIVYEQAPGGHGWVNAAYVQVTTTASGLPVLDDLGTPLPPEVSAQSTASPAAPTPTPAPAWEDGDSPAMPLVSVVFSHDGTRRFTSRDEVSSPQGDAEDWIDFSPYTLPGSSTAVLTASLTCSGNGSLMVELWQAGSLLVDWGSLGCGSNQVQLLLPVGGSYQFRLLALPGAGLQVSSYEFSLRNDP